MMLLTSSSMRVARSCRYRYHIQYELGYQSTSTAAELSFGSLVHRALEAWWTAAKRRQTKEEWLDAAIAQLAPSDGVDLYELERARVMMTGYHLRWANFIESCEVLAVEHEFAHQLGLCVVLAGKMDAIVCNGDNVWIVEHKTTSEDTSPGSSYWQRLRLDSQVSAYALASRGIPCSLGDPLGVWYDVLGKPRQRPGLVPVLDELGLKVVLDHSGDRVRTKTGKWRQTGDTVQGYTLKERQETPEEFRHRLGEEVCKNPDKYYSRATVVRLESELREVRADIIHLARSLELDTQEGCHPRNPDACHTPGRTCPFWVHCSGEAELDNTSLYVRQRPHHELSDELIERCIG